MANIWEETMLLFATLQVVLGKTRTVLKQRIRGGGSEVKPKLTILVSLFRQKNEKESGF